MGALGRRDSMRMLEAAYDAGIRHFDVAPMYGYGEAESCLGELLSRHPGQCSVTTKFGIPPQAQGTLAAVARATLRPILQRFPALKQSLSKPTQAPIAVQQSHSDASGPPRPPNPIFNVAEARASLQRSLAALRCERIDVWLLHDVTASDLPEKSAQTDDLLEFLQQSANAGQIGTFGVGTDRSQIAPLLALHPAFCPVTQYEWSVFNPVPAETYAFRIHHRALTSNFRALHADLAENAERCHRWSQITGADLANPIVLARLLLKAALEVNPASIILFSSKSPAHIQANVDLAAADSLSAPAVALYRIIQSELLT